MEVKAVVGAAKRWLTDVLKDEGITNIGLEEVEFDEQQNAWRITLGFSRPWNSVRNALTAISGEPAAKRSYRVILVRDANGEIISMKQRESVD